MKRFYKNAAVEKLGDGFTVALDGRAIKTPAKQFLAIGIEELAEAVAAEWQAQKDEIRHDSMPMMRFVCTSLDRVTPNRTEVIFETVKFCETDLLCYWAAQPKELAQRQAENWQPLLDWAETRYGASLSTTTGLSPIAQDETALARLRAAVEAKKHIFCEKPMATDAFGVRSVLESAKIAKANNTAITAGFCWRYNWGRREAFFILPRARTARFVNK